MKVTLISTYKGEDIYMYIYAQGTEELSHESKLSIETNNMSLWNNAMETQNCHHLQKKSIYDSSNHYCLRCGKSSQSQTIHLKYIYK